MLTLNEHNCFITLTFLKHFSTPRKDCYIFLLNVYFVKIKIEHGNVHFNYVWFQIFQIKKKKKCLFKLKIFDITMSTYISKNSQKNI